MEIRNLRQLALAIRARRLALGLSQAELAERAHVSRQWVIEFEAGKATAELGLTLRLFEALGLRFQLSAATLKSESASDDGIDLDTILSSLSDDPER